MNWLAHIFLSPRTIDFQLGNLLADPLKGRAFDDAPQEFIDGLAMHRKIDHFTDNHSLFLQSKQRLGARGILKGVVVDLVYDHYLARHWPLYSNVEFEVFLNQFYQMAPQQVANYPAVAQDFVTRLIASDRLRSYGQWQGLERVLELTDRRLSSKLKQRETTLSYLPVIDEQASALLADFKGFMPELILHCRQYAPLEHIGN